MYLNDIIMLAKDEMQTLQQYHPPSMGIALPVMKEALSEIKNSISGGTSF